MKLTITSFESGTENVGGLEIAYAAFAESTDTGSILVFERGLNPSEDDVRNGFDTYSISNENGESAYGGVHGAVLRGSVLELEFEPDVAKTLGLPDSLTLMLKLESSVFPAVADSLETVLGRSVLESSIA